METQTQTAPLGVIDSLSTGFSAVAHKPGLLLIPLLLDLFLWLGPRLSLNPIVPELTTRLRAFAGGTTDNSAELFQQNMAEILSSFNLFSALSTWPLGTPSLLAGNDPGIGPLGPPSTMHLQGSDQFLAWLLVLALGGLLLGSLYLSLIARWIKGNSVDLRTWTKRAWLYWVRIVILVFVVLVGAFLLSAAFFLALEIVALILAPLASLLLLVGIGIGMWGLFHLFFAVHGILIDDLTVSLAVSNSVALVRRYPFSTMGLLVIAVIINLGLSTIWNTPPSESWMRLVAIVGNAFINTGLAAATFVYYQERTFDPQSHSPTGKQTTPLQR